MKQNIYKNAGFPPIRYCPNDESKNKTSKERFIGTVPNKEINIRQLLSSNINKKPLIVDMNNNNLEVVTEL
jgi:hypothetical protein